MNLQIKPDSLVTPGARYLPLCKRLGLARGIPYTEYWSAGADFLELIVDHCLHARPSVILECSSGLTTLMLARACQMNGQGRVFSLEDGQAYADNSRSALDYYALGRWGRVLHAPLEPYRLDGRVFQWYGRQELPEAPVEMLVIDGPSSFIQEHSRYPALPLLLDRLAERCVIFLDDAARPGERETVAMWLKQFPHLEHAFRETERGCSVLKRHLWKELTKIEG